MKDDRTQIKEAGDDGQKYIHIRTYMELVEKMSRLQVDFADVSSALHVAEQDNVQMLKIKKAAQAVVRDADNYEFMFNDDELENLNVLANAVKEQA